MKSKSPSVEQIRQLKILASHKIPKAWEDQNGHVNVKHYQTLYEMGAWPLLSCAGLNKNYFEERKKGIFDLEQHLRYFNEIRVNDDVSVHGHVLDTNSKRLHGIILILNITKDKCACTLEFVASSVDLRTRKTADFPIDIQTGLRSLVMESKSIAWDIPLCGHMQI